MKRFWQFYALVGLCLIAYSVLGHIASKGASGTLVLSAGQSAEVSLLRINEGKLRLTVGFPRDDEGKSAGSPEAIQRKLRATTALTLTIVGADGVARPYHAYREGAHSFNPPQFFRAFWGQKPEQPDVWFPSDRSQDAPLFRGNNRIILKAETVDPVFEGVTVNWYISPALGFKSTEAEVIWLFWSVFWEIYLAAFAIAGFLVALVQVVWSRKKEEE